MSTDLFDFTSLLPTEDGSEPDQIDDVPDDPRVVQSDWPSCEVCGDNIEWSGRGRRPKKCAEHRRRTISRPDGPVTTRRSRAENERLERIELALATQGIKAGAIAGRLLPVTGLTLASRSEKFASSLVKICAHKPEYLDALEKIAAFEPVIDIVEFLAAITVAVGVDLRQVHPEGAAAQMLGVTAVWRELEDIEGSAQVEEPQPQYQPGAVGEPKAPMFGPGILPQFTPIGAGV